MQRVRDSLKLLAALFMVAAILISPHILIKGFIVFDTYPYTADVAFLINHGHIAWIHRLGTTPGYAIIYAIFSLVTNLSPYILVKAFPTFILITMAPLLASIPRNKKLRPLMVVLPFAFFINQPINFHRATLFLPYIPLAILLLKHSLKRRELRMLPLVALTFTSASSVYPMTLIIMPMLIVGLSLIMLVGVRKASTNNLSLRGLSMYVLVFIFSTLMYYMFFSLGGFIVNKDLQYILGNILNELKHLVIKPPTEIIHQGAYMAQGVTTEVKLVMILRVAVLGAITLMTSLCVFIWLLKTKQKQLFRAFLAYLWLIALTSLGAASFLLHYKGFPLKFLYEYVLLSAITFVVLLEELVIHTPVRRLIKVVIPAILAATLVFMPLISYASLPIIHPQLAELEASKFAARFCEWTYEKPHCNKLVYVEYSSPWNLDLLAYGRNVISFMQTDYSTLIDEIKLQDIVSNYPILITSRFILRDYYIVHEVRHSVVLSNAIKRLLCTKSLVYSSIGKDLSLRSVEYSLLFV